ncbi:hypothetical protein ILYODFUR_010890 [Ilyodon furcidens]|uniref:Uncharacterized protein n=1 Tax=Ilyodon furcidens TaxID=33524 RepID=A0ABV0V453_9TELE
MFPRRESRLSVEAGHGGAPEIAFPQSVSQSGEQAIRRVGGQVQRSRAGRTSRPLLPDRLSRFSHARCSSQAACVSSDAVQFGKRGSRSWRKHVRTQEQADLHRGGCSLRVCWVPSHGSSLGKDTSAGESVGKFVPVIIIYSGDAQRFHPFGNR